MSVQEIYEEALQRSRRTFPLDPIFHSLASRVQSAWPLLAITALGLILRLINLNVSFWYDEGFTGHHSRQTIGELLRFLISQEEAIDVHPPLYYLTINIWAQVSHTDVWIRYFSVLTGVSAIPILFTLCRKMFNKEVGLIACAFLAVSPFHLLYSQEARTYSLYVLLVVIALWLLATALQSPGHYNPWWLAYSCSAALILYTHGTGPLILMGLSLFHLCMIWPPDRIRFYQWIGFNTLGLLLFLPWLPVALHQATVMKADYQWVPPISLAWILSIMKSFIYFPPYDDAGQRAAMVWIIPQLVLIGVAVILPSRFERRKVMALMALATVPVVAISLYGYFAQNLFINRVLAPIVIPLLILPAIPVVTYSKSRWLPATCGITAVAIIFSLVSSLNYLHQRKGTEWREAASLVEKNIQADDGILLLPRDARFVFKFYFGDGRHGTPVVSLTSVKELIPHRLEDLGNRQRIWVLRDRVVGGGETREVLKWLKQKYVVQRESNLNRLDVLLIQPMQ